MILIESLKSCKRKEKRKYSFLILSLISEIWKSNLINISILSNWTNGKKSIHCTIFRRYLTDHCDSVHSVSTFHYKGEQRDRPLSSIRFPCRCAITRWRITRRILLQCWDVALFDMTVEAATGSCFASAKFKSTAIRCPG